MRPGRGGDPCAREIVDGAGDVTDREFADPGGPASLLEFGAHWQLAGRAMADDDSRFGLLNKNTAARLKYNRWMSINNINDLKY